MSSVTLKFSGKLTPSDPRTSPVLILGQMKNIARVSFEDIKAKFASRVSEEDFTLAITSLHPSPSDAIPLYLNLVQIAPLPIKCSRHNTPSRAHAVSKIIKSINLGSDQYVVVVCERSDVFPTACAIARAFPLYSRKTNLNSSGGASSTTSSKLCVTVEFLLVGGAAGEELTLNPKEVECLEDAAYGVRLSAKIVDAPCSEMHVDAFLDEIENVGKALGIRPKIIKGKDLEKQGFGGLWCVGKAATRLPALAVLSHTPEGAKQTIAWVGKGIVFDTGGLCIKTKTSMCGMKQDCGGAAGILGAFYLTVKQGFIDNLHAVFCLAENAVGPEATRPDDVVTLYSGRTVEINNTDAEGRLVVGDGVAYAQKDLQANFILDMCTLTGAQGIATGKYHAGLVTNNEEWEWTCLKAGRASGDLVHALPFCPELHFNEFASALADMKNSVADRSNAQVSCAALFIAAQIGFDFSGVWIHIDMASPVHCGERATGYGVALLAVLFGSLSNCSLLRSIAPPAQFSIENGVNVEQNASKKMRLS